MFDAQKNQVRTVEELILALHPVQTSALDSAHPEAAIAELRRMKSNISAVLAFTSHSLGKDLDREPEFRNVLDELRRECLLINGMISRIIFRQRWLFSVSKLEDIREVLTHYQEMAGVACRMCLLIAPESGSSLLNAL
jgi:hypothetical protein